ncbi:MAG: hypothetical protein WDN75_04610 [Bacteroidota bacterium]
MNKETRFVVNHLRFEWSLDDVIIPAIELWVLYYFAQRGYDNVQEAANSLDKVQGGLLFLAAMTGVGFWLRRVWQLNSFVVIETPLDMEENFLFCLDRVKMFNVDNRDFDKWNYSVGIRAHGDINPLPFWLTMICDGNKIYINERPAFYLLSLWWKRSGLDQMAAEIKTLQQKGKEYADAEIEKIRISMAEHEQARLEGNLSVVDPWERNIVIDPSAPAYFSRQVISGFALFFTAFAGAVLLAFNVDNRSGKVKILLLGAGFSILATVTLLMLPTSMVFVLWINGIGAGFISGTLWRKFVSKEIKYRTRSALIPFIAALVVYLPLLWIFIIAR